MQRNITYQDLSKLAGLFFILLVYEVLSSIYLLLPPLLGLFFLLFMYTIEKNRLDLFVFVLGYLLVFETDREFLLFSTLFFFALAYRLVVLRLRHIISCNKCLDYLSVAIAYIGFWLFTIILNQIAWMDLPSFDWRVLYYIVVEILVVALFL